MLGKPKFKVGDMVMFDIYDGDGVAHKVCGEVYIVDGWGTFGQNEEASYDIMVEHDEYFGDNILFKHITEPGVTLISE